MKTLRLVLLAFSFAAATLQADVVVTSDGARLVGRIVSIGGGKITLETDYAGTLTIDQAKVESFSTDDSMALRLESGTMMAGPVQGGPQGQVVVRNDDGEVTADVQDVSDAWAPGTRDPAVVAAESEAASKLRRWTYEAGADISGKAGNSVESSIGLSAEAKLEGPRDRLRFYGSYHRTEVEVPTSDPNDGDATSSEPTSDEAIGGVDFTSFFSERWGWFVREELERDTFEGIDFRSTSAGGITHRFVKRERLSLEGRLGLSYRYESYTATDTDAEGLPGMEAGVLFFWRFANWGELNTEIIYLPAFEDFGDYRLKQDTKIDIPLAYSNNWKLRVGLKNEYVSLPPAGREELDTTYSISLLLNWE